MKTLIRNSLFLACLFLVSQGIKGQEKDKNIIKDKFFSSINVKKQQAPSLTLDNLITPNNLNFTKKKFTNKSNSSQWFTSVTLLSYDGVLFNIEDSIKFYPRKDNYELALYMISSIFYYPPTTIDLNEELTQKLYFEATNTDSIYIYNWNDGQNKYEIDTKLKAVLDANGNTISETITYYNGSHWANNVKYVYTYTADSKLNSKLQQSWTSNAWKDEEFEKVQYNANGDVISYVNANNYSNTLDSNTKVIYSYNSQGDIEEMVNYYWDNNNWENLYKTELIYTGGLITKGILKGWDDITLSWEVEQEVELSYNSNNQITMILTKDIDSQNNATPDYRTRYTYHSSNQIESINDQYWDNGNWVYESREEYSYNTNNLLSEYITNEWDDALQQFEKKERYQYQYNSNDQITDISSQGWNGSNWDYQINYYAKARLHYGDPTGLSKNLGLNDALTLYPNPANEKLNIKMNAASVEYVRITDINGKVVFENKNKLQAAEISIPTDNLSNGVYFVEVESKGQTGLKKFIVQH